MIDVRVLGVQGLQQKLNRLPGVVARKVVVSALRKSTKRIHGYVLANIARLLASHTGTYARAWAAAKVRAGKHPRGMIRIGLRYPDRDELGIAPDDPYFYPFAIEYGHAAAGSGTYAGGGGKRVRKTASKDVPAIPHVRPAVDDNKATEHALIGRDIGRGIKREAKRA